MTTRQTFISSLLIALLALAITPNLYAQQTSTATMQVQVTVVEGFGVTQANTNNSNTLDLSSLSGGSKLTTIMIGNRTSKAYALERPNTLKLTNRNGQHLKIPISYVDSIERKGLVSKVSTELPDPTKLTSGTYKGSYTTTVAYL